MRRVNTSTEEKGEQSAMTQITAHDLNIPAERVLATLNPDGSRHWLKPRLSKGVFLNARRVVAYFLIALFAVLPYITINGKPAMLLDIAARRFTFFGTTFFPTDTLLLAVLMLIIFLSIFLVTAIAGRVWCGWACPQTVYMEFLYRPIERLVEGTLGKGGAAKKSGGWRRALKYALYLIASCYLAHIFLAYFVGVDRLAVWITQSPLEHPTPFLVMAITTALMMFDFVYFREQTCLVACPYGRLQAAMLDRHTMIVTYDQRRGEPRGKWRRPAKQVVPPDVALPILRTAGVSAEGSSGVATQAAPTASRGDCIDCKMCVTTCPTGIDIRDGLQLECIGCAQCIDACDSVMDKIGKPRGLVRYSSRAILEGAATRLLRPRTVLYPSILLGLIGLFFYLLAHKATGEAAILPRQGAPFYSMPSGEIANQLRLRLVNRGDDAATFSVELAPESIAAGAHLIAEHESMLIEPGQSLNTGLIVAAPPEAFSSRGKFEAALVVRDGRSFTQRLTYGMLGPVHRRAASGDAEGAP